MKLFDLILQPVDTNTSTMWLESDLNVSLYQIKLKMMIKIICPPLIINNISFFPHETSYLESNILVICTASGLRTAATLIKVRGQITVMWWNLLLTVLHVVQFSHSLFSPNNLTDLRFTLANSNFHTHNLNLIQKKPKKFLITWLKPNCILGEVLWISPVLILFIIKLQDL